MPDLFNIGAIDQKSRDGNVIHTTDSYVFRVLRHALVKNRDI